MDERVFVSTGSPVNAEAYKVVRIPCGNHEVLVRLTQDNHFVDIAELRLSRDFLSAEQRVANTGCLDVEEFYRE